MPSIVILCSYTVRPRIWCLWLLYLVGWYSVQGFQQPHSHALSAKTAPSSRRSRHVLRGFSWKNPFADIVGGGNQQPTGPPRIEEEEARSRLKQELLDRCRMEESKDKRSFIEETIEELSKTSPTDNAATSNLLLKQWDLVWTTEKEINFFIERGWSNQITQTLEPGVLQNMIPFQRGGGLGVKGSIQADKDNPLRTQFQFDSATLDLAKWGSYQVPPIGAGWFDTVFLDETLRVDLNSRNDILICTPSRDEDKV